MNTGKPQKLALRMEKIKAENRELKDKLTALKKENQLSVETSLQSQEILKHIPVSLLLIQRGNIVLANQTAQDQLGYSEEEIMALTFLDLVHPDSQKQLSRLYHRMVTGSPVPGRFEAYLNTKTGERLFYELRIKKIKLMGRRAFLISLMDLDHWKQKEIRDSRYEKREALRRMAAGLNQELNAFMRMLNENALPTKNFESLTDADYSKYLERIENMKEKGSRIIENLATLTMGKPNNSNSVRFDLKKIVQNAVASTLPKQKDGSEEAKPNIKAKTYLRNIAPVKGDPEKIRSVFMNMISNAVEALPDGGEIYLTTEANSRFAYVYIQDNGVGIPDDIKERIFDPFFTTKQGKHTGLGLSLAHAIIHQHNGEIESISNEGQGTTFVIKIPLVRSLPSPKSKNARNRIKDSHILVISDEGIFQDLLFQLFVSKGGKIFPASNGTEALKLMKKKSFDLAIVDLSLTYRESSRIISKIKEMNRGIPIALISPEETETSVQILDKLKVDLVITRPLEMSSTLSLVSQVLSMRNPSQ